MINRFIKSTYIYSMYLLTIYYLHDNIYTLFDHWLFYSLIAYLLPVSIANELF